MGWALLSCGVATAFAQGTQPVGTQSIALPGTGTPAADAAPAVDPITGVTIPSDGSTPVDSTTGTSSTGAGTPGGAGINPTVTVAPAVTPSTTLPAITPQNNTGSSITGPTINMNTTPVNEVTTLPSYGTTIVNAPFGTSVPAGVLPSVGGAGGGAEGDELGITLGSFRLYPALEMNIGADSNVFAQNASQGTVGSLYTTIAPSLDLRSDWLNHALHVGLSGIAGFYNSAPTQNYQNYTLIADGKIDIQTDFYLTWSVALKRATEALGTPNVAFAQAPTIDNTIPVSLGLYQRFNRLFYEAKVSATRYSYIDNSTIFSTGLPAASRDRTEYEESIKLGYELYEDLAVFIQPGLNQRRYLDNDNTAGQQRDSNGQTFLVGSTWKPTAATALEATAGYTTQNYPSLGGSDSSFTYGLAGTWNGYAPLTLRPSITRGIIETALSNYKNYVQTTYAVDFNYLIHDAWTAVGGISVTTADYNPIAGSGANPRTDTLYRAQIGFLYALRPQIQIGPFFEYTAGTTTDPSTGPIYDREIFSVRLIAKR